MNEECELLGVLVASIAGFVGGAGYKGSGRGEVNSLMDVLPFQVTERYLKAMALDSAVADS